MQRLGKARRCPRLTPGFDLGERQSGMLEKYLFRFRQIDTTRTSDEQLGAHRLFQVADFASR